jgi:hypothetical protein
MSMLVSFVVLLVSFFVAEKMLDGMELKGGLEAA